MIIKDILLKLITLLLFLYLIVFIPIIWGYHPLIIVSNSMEPTLKVGGILYYHKESINSYKKNDILVFKIKNNIISHRIIKINDNSFITKGDANKKIDSSNIVYNQIIGKGTNFSIPYIGYYIDFIHRHKYLLLIVCITSIISLRKAVLKNE